ncbi:MAG: glycosyltransferase family 2 protein [Bacteroidales bacterium]|nr:glycosyltransferase family 2 protein [Bacteroidales bacterium]MDY0196859.1 glycosyltransferase family 2 protein [Tenuifilaceae bacterium]
MKSIAIVILNWNGLGHLKQFLPSVIANSKVEGFTVDVVVADNGSTDDSVQWLNTLTESIKIICLDKNYGFTGGYNRALKQINSDYYVILNSDVEVNNNWLEPMASFIEQNPNVAACMPKLNSYAAPKYFEYAGAAGGYIDFLGYPFCRGRVLNIVEQDNGQYNEAKEIFWATGACIMVRATDFWSVGAFDEDFFAHMEEIDLCWRLKRSGKSIWCIPNASVLHVGGGTLAVNNPQKAYFNHRNNLLMLLKNLSRQSIVPVMLVRFLLDYASAFSYLITGKPKFTWSVIKAHSYFFGKCFSFVKKRRMFKHPKIKLYPTSILLQFFVFKRKLFSTLPNKGYF